MRKADKRLLAEGNNEFAAWLRVCRHFFPRLPIWLKKMADPRNQMYITYNQAVLIMMCIVKNISGVESMRSMNDAFSEDVAIYNLSIAADDPSLFEMPDWQTVNNYLEKLDVHELEKIRRLMMVALLRTKQFDRYKFQGRWTIILDGTGIAYFKERHCQHDLVTKITNPETGETRLLYYHKVLEAKMVLAPGIVISIDTEFIENEQENVTKQDCELRAAERLLERLKKNYPRLPILILGDGLYATMPFMKMCSERNWHYILNLKEGRQNSLFEDYDLLVNDEKFNNRIKNLCGEENGIGAFANRMDKISNKPQTCNVYEYTHKELENDTLKDKRYVWVTDMRLTKKNLESFIRKGRERWKIENEGFNNQKNGIYKIEHLCSREPNAMKAHYLITQISDIIMQLYLRFDKRVQLLSRTIKDAARRIEKAFLNTPITSHEKSKISVRCSMRLQADSS